MTTPLRRNTPLQTRRTVAHRTLAGRPLAATLPGLVVRVRSDNVQAGCGRAVAVPGDRRTCRSGRCAQAHLGPPVALMERSRWADAASYGAEPGTWGAPGPLQSAEAGCGSWVMPAYRRPGVEGSIPQRQRRHHEAPWPPALPVVGEELTVGETSGTDSLPVAGGLSSVWMFPFWIWAVTIVAIVGMLVFDFVGHVRTPHAPTLRESAIWSAVYVGIAIVFGARPVVLRGRVRRVSTSPAT